MFFAKNLIFFGQNFRGRSTQFLTDFKTRGVTTWFTMVTAVDWAKLYFTNFVTKGLKRVFG